MLALTRDAPAASPPARSGGAFPANRYTSYMTSSTSIDVSLKHKEMVRPRCAATALRCCFGWRLERVFIGTRAAGAP